MLRQQLDFAQMMREARTLPQAGLRATRFPADPFPFRCGGQNRGIPFWG